MNALASALLLFMVAACGENAAAAPNDLPRLETADAFWDHWGDGRAELTGYRLKFPRYGEIRDGRATLVFVTERFTEAQRVKSDGGHTDEYPVLKMNLVRDFQTGIYDYNAMTSAFLRLDGSSPLGEPVKVSMSMQEWCGHVYEQLVPEDDALTWTSHSYFDGEADRIVDLGRKRDAILLDALPMLVRGLVGPLVQRGQSVTVPALTNLTEGRLLHRSPVWTTVTVARQASVTTVTTPAGTFEVDTYTTDVEAGVTTTWSVETAWPHRLVRWSTTAGEVAEMLASERLPYWMHHNNGDEALLEKLGHPVPASAWEDPPAR